MATILIPGLIPGLISGLIVGGGCWGDRGSCDLWAGKLANGKEVATAVQELADNRCVAQRGLLLEHLGDENLRADVFSALMALGRSPEAEKAIAKGLKQPSTVVAAAEQAAKWKLTAALPALREALADEALGSHHRALLDAGLALAPPEQWIGVIAHDLAAPNGGAAAVDEAFDVLAEVDWSKAPASARATVVAVLAELLSRPDASVTAARRQAAAVQLARVPRPDPLPPLKDVVARAAAGSRAALLALWSLEHPETRATALALVRRDGLPWSARASALAVLLGAPPDDMAALVRAAPGDAAVLEGLALLGGGATVEALNARLDHDKGVARAAAARALGLALPAARLAAWRATLKRHPSQLVRGIPEDARVVAEVALTKRCRQDAACYVKAIHDQLPQLAKLDDALTVARAAVKAAEKKAQTAVAADAARARELAKAQGAALKAAHAELDRIQQRRDAAYAGVSKAQHEVDGLVATAQVALVSLVRAARYADDVSRGPLAEAALAVIERCRGAACAPLRVLAVAALKAHGVTARPEEVDAAATSNTDDPALWCVLARMKAPPR